MAKEVKLSDRVHGADTKASSKMLNIDESEIIDFSSISVSIYINSFGFNCNVNISFVLKSSAQFSKEPI